MIVVSSRELVYNMSEAVSYELRAFYNDDMRRGVYGQSGLSCFSPVINIMRHPLWGRNQVKVWIATQCATPITCDHFVLRTNPECE